MRHILSSPLSALSSSWLFLSALTLCAERAHSDVFEDVPEAAEYQLVYALQLPERGNFSLVPIPYEIDQRADWEDNFDRVAYYLQLQRAGEEAEFIFVSGDAFTRSALQLGLPSAGSGISHQRPLNNMTVLSNVPGIVEGSGLSGLLEIWEWNYGPGNAARIEGASGDLYDFGDAPLWGQGMYGSFQIHQLDAGQTLIAYNRFNDDAPADLGIGDNQRPAGDGQRHSDWTFLGNAGEYSVRQLQVLLRPGAPPASPAMVLDSPQSCQVFQRQRGDVGVVSFRGRLSRPGDRVEARFVSESRETTTQWQLIDDTISDGFFSGAIRARAGHYRVELRVMLDGEQVATHQVEAVGVGEVFVIAGQSNSANHGLPALVPVDPRVCATDGMRWAPAEDPQPIATGAGGSPWPAFGDLFAERYQVPVGIMSVGWGGTAVAQWLPGAPMNLFARLQLAQDALGEDGFRAVLWHQGESDAAAGTSAEVYAERLRALIEAMRVYGGWAIPWGVAQVSYLPRLSQAQMDAISSAQEQVIRETPFVFAGPTTDDLIGADWRYDAVHFNERGLREHARRWVEAISLPPCQGFENVPSQLPCEEQRAFPDAAPIEGEALADGGAADDGAADGGAADGGAADSTVERADGAPPRDALLAGDSAAREERDARAPRERGEAPPEMNDREVDSRASNPPGAQTSEERQATGESGCSSTLMGSGPLAHVLFMVLISLITRRSRRRAV